MRVVFCGNAEWSIPLLEALAASSHDLVLVVTREPRPAGRRRRPRPTPVAGAARRLGAVLEEVATVKDGPGFAAIERASPDVLAVVAYGEILPKALLDVPRVAPVNVHFSLLPALRGADPVRRAILDGLEVTGVSTMIMDEGLDTGPVLLWMEEPLRPEDDAGSLGARLAAAGGRLLTNSLDGLEAGSIEPTPQDEERATYAPKLKADDEWIDWSRPSEEVLRLVRALAPAPGARMQFRGKVLKVLAASPAAGEAEPGTVLTAGQEGLTIATGGGAVSLEEVLPEGKRRMSGADFVRGYRPETGSVLG